MFELIDDKRTIHQKILLIFNCRCGYR